MELVLAIVHNDMLVFGTQYPKCIWGTKCTEQGLSLIKLQQDHHLQSSLGCFARGIQRLSLDQPHVRTFSRDRSAVLSSHTALLHQ